MKDLHWNMTFNRKSQSGLAVVEFLIVLIMLIPMLVATVEFGRYLHQYNTLTKAVRDGARYASDNAVTSSGLVSVSSTLMSETQNLVAYGNTVQANGTEILNGITAGDVSVTTVDVAGISPSPSHVRVSATYDFEPLFGFIPDTIGITMTASTVQRGI
jgi:Flp pilus assembly protein TadG